MAGDQTKPDGLMRDVRALCEFEGRLAGTDAERRAANHLARRLRRTAHRVDVEPTYVHPQWALVVALHCVVGFAGSLVAVAVPGLGFAMALLAATSLYLDVNARFYLLRRLFFRRASQNVIARGRNRAAAARLVIAAHYDAAKTGSVFRPSRMRLLGAIAKRAPFPFGPFRLVFWSLAILVPLTGLRAAGIDSDAIAVAQLIPTLVLLVSIFLLVDIELSPVVPGANDNASGVAVALALAERLTADPVENMDVWVVMTGGEECLMEGMRSFLRAHGSELDRETTYVIAVDSVGNGDVRWTTSEGLVVAYDLDRRMGELAQAIATADAEDENRYRAAPLAHAFATDALAARTSGRRAISLSTLEEGALVPANYHLLGDTPDNLDPGAMARARDFALELIHALDRDVGRSRGG